MKARYQLNYWLILLIIATLISVTYYYWHQHHIIQPKNTASQPDSYGKNIHIVSFGKDGNIASLIEAPIMQHFANNVTIFITPKVTVYSSKQPWIITAKQANASANFKTIILIGDVKFAEAAGSNNPASLLTTTEMTIQTDTEIASTNKAVQYQQINHNGSTLQVTAIGFTANKKTGIVRLLANVRGIYVPASTQ